MSDLPIEEKKEVPLTLEQRVGILEKDMQEVARGVNLQGALLQAIVVAFDHVCKKYLDLTTVPEKEKVVEKPKA